MNAIIVDIGLLKSLKISTNNTAIIDSTKLVFAVNSNDWSSKVNILFDKKFVWNYHFDRCKPGRRLKSWKCLGA